MATRDRGCIWISILAKNLNDNLKINGEVLILDQEIKKFYVIDLIKK